jgi:sarcosine oxidase gamma subunit
VDDGIRITGGAGHQEAAAIAAVVAAIEAEEKAAMAAANRAIPRSQWIEAGRPLEHVAPTAPDEYAKRPGQVPDDQ